MRRAGSSGLVAAERLLRLGHTVAVAESSSGGLISAALLAVPGASAWFLGGGVVYTARSRRVLLDIRPEDVAGIEPLTEPMAAHFAARVRERLGATWGLAELGIAGPAPARYGHAPGISVIAVDGPVCLSATIRTGLDDREENMERFASGALGLLEKALASTTGPP